MAELAFPFLSLGIAAPLAAAAWTSLRGEATASRWPSLAGAGVAVLCALEALREVVAAGSAALAEPWGGTTAPWLVVDSLSAAPLALFALVAFGVLLVLPRRDRHPGMVSALLLVLGATFAGYAAGNTALLLVAWCASAAPILFARPDSDAGGSNRYAATIPAVMLGASAVSLTLGLGLMAWSRAAESADPFALAGTSGGAWAFAFLMLAVLLRKGVFPFHSWILTAFKRGPLMLTVLLMNTHLGAYLVARVGIPCFPDIAGSALSLLSDLALLTGIYAAVVALAESDPRRLIGLLAISQSSFILAGLETATPEGVAGGLVYWMVVTVATTSLVAVYRLLEVRVGRPISGDEFLGLGAQFPRLAVFFLVSGLALVGLPGTLGFCADELLLHGAMESHPQLGLALPLATALNAFNILRLFARLFLGSRGIDLPGVPDARPAERWALTCGMLFLVGGGLFPGHFVDLRAHAAQFLSAASQAAANPLADLLR